MTSSPVELPPATRLAIRAMRQEYGITMPISVSATVSVILSVVGIVGLVAVYLRF